MLAKTHCSMRLHGSITWSLVHMFNIILFMLFLCFIGLCLVVVFEIAITLHTQNKSLDSLS